MESRYFWHFAGFFNGPDQKNECVSALLATSGLIFRLLYFDPRNQNDSRRSEALHLTGYRLAEKPLLLRVDCENIVYDS